MSNIFTVTVIGSPRGTCYGYFHALDEAKKAVEENRTDIHECCYTLLVIEEKIEGMRAGTVNEYWYKYDDCTCDGTTLDCNGKWVECEKPHYLIGIVGFGMG